MNKAICILLSVLWISGCTTKPIDDKKAELDKLKKEQIQLSGKIRNLEKEIQETDTLNFIANNRVIVQVKTMKPEKYEHIFEVNGSVKAEKNIVISPEVPGQIKVIYIKEGDHVMKGQLLASLDTKTIENSMEEVKKTLELATAVYNRQKNLWDQKIGTEIQFLEAKNRKESLEKRLATMNGQLKMAIIKAPINGTVDAIHLKEGELASPGMPFLQIVDLSGISIEADVSENYVKNIKRGDRVDVRFPSLGIKKNNVPVIRTSDIIHPKNRTFKVEAKIENPDNLLKSNAIGVMRIRDFQSDSAYIVPAIIIGMDSKGTYLYKTKTTNSKMLAQKVYVKTGETGGGQTMVTSGLQTGDKVIVSGFNEVSNGAEVQIIK